MEHQFTCDDLKCLRALMICSLIERRTVRASKVSSMAVRF